MGRQVAKLVKRLRRRAATGIMGALIFMAVIAALAIAFGILFGVFDKITTDLSNSNITVASEFTNSIGTAKSFTSLGITIALAVGVITVVMYLVYAIRSGMGGQ